MRCVGLSAAEGRLLALSSDEEGAEDEGAHDEVAGEVLAGLADDACHWSSWIGRFGRLMGSGRCRPRTGS